MKKNKKISKRLNAHVVFATHSGALLLGLFAMVIMYLLASSSCQQQHKRIGEQERELKRLEDSLNREALRWEEMHTPDKVARALLKHGLAMRPAHPNQNIQMREDGRPYPHQISVAQARARNGGVAADYRRRR